MKEKIKPLSECEWHISINEVKLEETQAQWSARCLTMDGMRFATGGVGSINCVHLFSSFKDAKEGWIEFAKINGITKYKFTPSP